MSYAKVITGLSLGVAAVALAVTPTSATNSDHKVGICHATGSTKNPYVYIVVDQHAADAHARHQDRRDIIGVSSAAACPKPAVATPTPTPKPTATPAPTSGQGGSSTNGNVLGASATQQQPTTLPETGAGLETLLGLPAIAAAGAAYLRSRFRR